MMKIIKKNQLTILVLALMLVTAGYLNYNANTTTTTGTEIASLGDATLVSSNVVMENENTSTNAVSNEVIENAVIEEAASTNLASNEEANVVETNADTESEKNAQDYYTSSRLERDTMYSQMLEAYQKILDSKTTSNKQKEEAQKEIKKINDTKNAIMIAENLIKTKGFEDCIVYSNDDSINVVIKKNKLSKEDTAQIQSIIAREMNAKLSNIHIMTK